MEIKITYIGYGVVKKRTSAAVILDERQTEGPHIGTLQCAEGFHSQNGHSVSKDTDSPGPGNPRIIYKEILVSYSTAFASYNTLHPPPTAPVIDMAPAI